MQKLARPVLFAALLVLPATATNASDHSISNGPSATVTGVIRASQPTIRFDPQSSWMLDQASRAARASEAAPFHVVHAAQLVAPVLDPMALWLGVNGPANVYRWRGAQLAGMLESTDPRMTGWISSFWATDTFPGALAVPDTAVHTVGIKLVTSGGSWSGTLVGAGDPASGTIHVEGVLQGEGAYEGDAAIFHLTRQGTGQDWTVEGLIVMSAPVLS